jgi:membrane protease YdiL (CAAX protease family)
MHPAVPRTRELTRARDDAPTVRPHAGAVDVAAVRRELAVFLGLQLVLTAATTAVALGQGADIRHIDDATVTAQAALYLSAFLPLLSAIAARRLVHGAVGWSGLGLRRAPWQRLALAWVVTAATVLASAGATWLTGLGRVDLSSGGTLALLGLTVVVMPYVLLALGEEVGWRGLVVTRLSLVARPRTVVLVSGGVWSAFHWPLILWLGGTPEGVSPWFAVVAFTISLTAFAGILASMQLRWGIWPVCVAHAVWNATLYQVVEPLTVGGARSGWFATETGAFLAVASVIAAVAWWRRFPLRVGPDGRSTTT